MELELQRLKKRPKRTPGELRVNGLFFGYTIEDQLREIPGRPAAEWKVKGATAIGADRYRVTLKDSPRFGKDTITLHGVDEFDYIRMHAGNDENDTEGCPCVGYELAADDTISVGQTRPAVTNLKRIIRAALNAGEEVWITVKNPPGYAG